MDDEPKQIDMNLTPDAVQASIKKIKKADATALRIFNLLTSVNLTIEDVLKHYNVKFMSISSAQLKIDKCPICNRFITLRPQSLHYPTYFCPSKCTATQIYGNSYLDLLVLLFDCPQREIVAGLEDYVDAVKQRLENAKEKAKQKQEVNNQYTEAIHWLS
jgi:hypothetical protein